MFPLVGKGKPTDTEHGHIGSIQAVDAVDSHQSTLVLDGPQSKCMLSLS